MQKSGNHYIAFLKFNAPVYWACNIPAAVPLMFMGLIKSSKNLETTVLFSTCSLFSLLCPRDSRETKFLW